MRPYLEITKFNCEPIGGEVEGFRHYKVQVEIVAFSPQNELEKGEAKCIHYGQLIGGTKTEINIFPGIGTINGSGTCEDPYIVRAEFESAKVPYGLWLCIARVVDNKGQGAYVKKGLKVKG